MNTEVMNTEVMNTEVMNTGVMMKGNRYEKIRHIYRFQL